MLHSLLKIGKIPSLGADCICLDCEDGVAINKKVKKILYGHVSHSRKLQLQLVNRQKKDLGNLLIETVAM